MRVKNYFKGGNAVDIVLAVFTMIVLLLIGFKSGIIGLDLFWYLLLFYLIVLFIILLFYVVKAIKSK